MNCNECYEILKNIKNLSYDECINLIKEVNKNEDLMYLGYDTIVTIIKSVPKDYITIEMVDQIEDYHHFAGLHVDRIPDNVVKHLLVRDKKYNSSGYSEFLSCVKHDILLSLTQDELKIVVEFLISPFRLPYFRKIFMMLDNRDEIAKHAFLKNNAAYKVQWLAEYLDDHWIMSHLNEISNLYLVYYDGDIGNRIKNTKLNITKDQYFENFKRYAFSQTDQYGNCLRYYPREFIDDDMIEWTLKRDPSIIADFSIRSKFKHLITDDVIKDIVMNKSHIVTHIPKDLIDDSMILFAMEKANAISFSSLINNHNVPDAYVEKRLHDEPTLLGHISPNKRKDSYCLEAIMSIERNSM